MKNNPENKQLIQEWIDRANDDELNAIAVLKYKEGTPANVCFLSQQISEKYFKALLLFFSNDYPRVHDLDKLATMLKEYLPEVIKELSEEIITLNPYYIATRYPVDISLESFTWDMAEEAYDAMEEIKKFVLLELEK